MGWPPYFWTIIMVHGMCMVFLENLKDSGRFKRCRWLTDPAASKNWSAKWSVAWTHGTSWDPAGSPKHGGYPEFPWFVISPLHWNGEKRRILNFWANPLKFGCIFAWNRSLTMLYGTFPLKNQWLMVWVGLRIFEVQKITSQIFLVHTLRTWPIAKRFQGVLITSR